MNQNLTDRVGSPPILNPKGTTQNLNCKEFPLRPEGAQEPFFKKKRVGTKRASH